MRDALVEGVSQHLALGGEGSVVAEVPPETERDRREQQPRRAHSPVVEVLVAILRSDVRLVGLGNGVGVVALFGHDVHASAMQTVRIRP